MSIRRSRSTKKATKKTKLSDKKRKNAIIKDQATPNPNNDKRNAIIGGSVLGATAIGGGALYLNSQKEDEVVETVADVVVDEVPIEMVEEPSFIEQLIDEYEEMLETLSEPEVPAESVPAPDVGNITVGEVHTTAEGYEWRKVGNNEIFTEVYIRTSYDIDGNIISAEIIDSPTFTEQLLDVFTFDDSNIDRVDEKLVNKINDDGTSTPQILRTAYDVDGNVLGSEYVDPPLAEEIVETVKEVVDAVEEAITAPLRAINIVGDASGESLDEPDATTTIKSDNISLADEGRSLFVEGIYEPYIEPITEPVITYVEELPEKIAVLEDRYVAPVIEYVEEIYVAPIIAPVDNIIRGGGYTTYPIYEPYIAPAIEKVVEYVEPYVAPIRTSGGGNYYFFSNRKQPAIIVRSEKQLTEIKRNLGKRAKNLADGIPTKTINYNLDMRKIGKGIGTIDLGKTVNKVKKKERKSSSVRNSESYKIKNLENISAETVSLGLDAVALSQGHVVDLGSSVGTSRDLVSIDQKLRPADERSALAKEYTSSSKTKKQ